MINGKSVLAVIPARGGSKGLSGKNTLLLAGKPLIAWTIESAKRSKYIDRCIISTDDKNIADVSIKYGGEIPFMRPSELATDKASSSDVIIHSIETLEEKYDLILLLQPTSPLRLVGDIDGALETFIDRDVNTLVSVCLSEHPPEWSITINKDNLFGNSAKLLMNGKRRQDFETTYDLNGSIFLSNVCDYKITKSFYSHDTLAYIIPKERSIDIDERDDFDYAEYIIKNRL